MELEPPEGIRAELLRGTVVMTPSPDLVHKRSVTDVVDQIPRSRWSRLQAMRVDMFDDVSAPVPDVVVVERDACPKQGALVPAGVVTAVIEVVSGRSADRDYLLKRSVYAAAKVPAYLIIDPVMAQCVLLSEPKGGGEDADYRRQRHAFFGELMPLEPLGLELDTSEFAAYENVRPHRYP
ncbi:Uma2 family endonuclease [Streptomyces sp. NPDC005811]|uniref:Uma2 family endonuclease n=1 Tax=Streptomyces sp. NPDC005811 TaxID=3154565 RepID=UPI0033D52E14